MTPNPAILKGMLDMGDFMSPFALELLQRGEGEDIKSGEMLGIWQRMCQLFDLDREYAAPAACSRAPRCIEGVSAAAAEALQRSGSAVELTGVMPRPPSPAGG